MYHTNNTYPKDEVINLSFKMTNYKATSKFLNLWSCVGIKCNL